jgi:hypothetical protein
MDKKGFDDSGFPTLIITGTKDYYNMGGEKQTVFVLEPLEVPDNVL